jgi:hypothetical protein
VHRGVGAGVGGVGRRGAAQTDGEASGRLWLCSRANRFARRRVLHAGAPTAPVVSAGRSDGGVVVPKDPQRPC